MNVVNKTIVVTGGGNGLGRELVMELLRRGAKIIAVDINSAALKETEELAKSISDQLSTKVLDITDRDQVERFANETTESNSTVDGLINNAGIIQPFVTVNDLDYGTIDRVFNVDFFGTLYMTKAFLGHFLKLPEAHIVNISSMGGLFPVPGQSIYGAAKSAVKLFTEALQAEMEATSVRTTLVCPGGIETDIKFNSGASTKHREQNEIKKAKVKPLKPLKAAQLIIDAMEKNKQKILIGSDIKSLNLIHKLSPRVAMNLINTQMKSHIPMGQQN